MKKLLILLLSLTVFLSFAACENKENQEDNKFKEVNDDTKTTYIVGFDNTFAPMGFEKDGENMGFDIDIAKKVEKKLGVKFEFQPIDWTLKESELESKNIDMIWNGYSITKERKEKVLFSEPYMKNRILIMVNNDSEIKNKSDLKNKIVCTQDQSSSLVALNKDEISNNLKEIVTYASFNDVFNDLKTERSDAIVVDETLGLYYLSNSGDSNNFKILEDNLGEEEYAVGFRKSESQDFIAKFNDAIKDLKNNGEIDKVYKKWFK